MSDRHRSKTPPPSFEPLFADSDDAARLGGGRRITYHHLTTSTNDDAAAAARVGVAHGSLVVAEEQSAGRGRRGRAWLTPPGRALLLSYLARGPGLHPERLGWLALAAGLAVAEAIQQTSRVVARVKWPNDVVVLLENPDDHDGPPWRKLGGVLVESSLGGAESSKHAIVGVGLNILQRRDELPALPKAAATSLRVETGRNVSRRRLLKALVERLDERLAWAAEDGASDGFDATRSAIEKRMKEAWHGWRFLARTPDGPREGAFVGLDAAGQLRLRLAHHRVVSLHDAEVLSGERDR
jgi:BirA family biotin operon repressor/biotin-[acetyl-CoA-carboxylase] ligase